MNRRKEKGRFIFGCILLMAVIYVIVIGTMTLSRGENAAMQTRMEQNGKSAEIVTDIGRYLTAAEKDPAKRDELLDQASMELEQRLPSLLGSTDWQIQNADGAVAAGIYSIQENGSLKKEKIFRYNGAAGENSQVSAECGRLLQKLEETLAEEAELGDGDWEMVPAGDGERSGYYGFGWDTVTQDTARIKKQCWYRQISGSEQVIFFVTVNEPFPEVVKECMKLYIVWFVIFVLIGGVFIAIHCRTIDLQNKLERNRRNMTDHLAHEMKTPLSIIKNYGEALKEEYGKQKQEEYTSIIIEEADSMNDMVVNLLDLSKLEAEAYPLELSSISLCEIVKNEVERTEILRQRKGIELKLQQGADIRIVADEKLVSRAVSNLLMNGIRHCSDGGAMEIVTQNGVSVSVYNEGKSIEEAEQEKIWTAFYSGNKKRGTGIGLALVRHTALLHRGTCGCKNEQNGVRFFFQVESLEDGVSADMKTQLRYDRSSRMPQSLLLLAGSAFLWALPSLLMAGCLHSGFLSGIPYDYLGMEQWAWIALIGWFMASLCIWFTARKIKRIWQPGIAAGLLTAASVLYIIAARRESTEIWYGTEAGYEASGIDFFLLPGIIILIFVPCFVWLTSRCFWKLAEQYEDVRFGKRLKLKVGIYLAGYALCAGIVFLDRTTFSLVGILMVAALTGIVAHSWYQVYNRFCDWSGE